MTGVEWGLRRETGERPERFREQIVWAFPLQKVGARRGRIWLQSWQGLSGCLAGAWEGDRLLQQTRRGRVEQLRSETGAMMGKRGNGLS